MTQCVNSLLDVMLKEFTVDGYSRLRIPGGYSWLRISDGYNTVMFFNGYRCLRIVVGFWINTVGEGSLMETFRDSRC